MKVILFSLLMSVMLVGFVSTSKAQCPPASIFSPTTIPWNGPTTTGSITLSGGCVVKITYCDRSYTGPGGQPRYQLYIESVKIISGCTPTTVADLQNTLEQAGNWLLNNNPHTQDLYPCDQTLMVQQEVYINSCWSISDPQMQASVAGACGDGWCSKICNYCRDIETQLPVEQDCTYGSSPEGGNCTNIDRNQTIQYGVCYAFHCQTNW